MASYRKTFVAHVKMVKCEVAGVKRPGGHDGGFHVQLGDKSNGQTAQWVFSISASFHSIS